MRAGARRPVRCKTDATHTRFDEHKCQCVQCQSALQAACVWCGEWKSYAHVKSHETNKCKERPSSPSPVAHATTVRFSYWASEWKVKKRGGGFATAPRGQLWEGVPAEVPKRHRFRAHQVKDSSMRGMQWMDAYDALFARIATSPGFELVTVYHAWDQVVAALQGEDLCGVHVLVLGNWAHHVTTLEDWRHQFELDVERQSSSYWPSHFG